MHPVILYTSIFFLIGGLITYFTNKKRTAESRKKSWVKFTVYLFIVSLWLSLLLYSYTSRLILALLILIIGLFELIFLYKRREIELRPHRLFIFSVILYLIAGWGFFNHFILFNSTELVFIFFIVFAFDGFSQIIGQLLGKRKILPVISPGKTVEGFIGGLIMAVLAGLLISNYSNIAFVDAVLYSAVVGISSFLGDMLASWNKRVYAVKDYSNLIPGHGGVLDRFDSWLLAGAVAYYIISIFNLN